MVLSLYQQEGVSARTGSGLLKGREEILIKWLGSPSSSNSWVAKDELIADGFEDEVKKLENQAVPRRGNQDRRGRKNRRENMGDQTDEVHLNLKKSRENAQNSQRMKRREARAKNLGREDN